MQIWSCIWMESKLSWLIRTKIIFIEMNEYEYKYEKLLNQKAKDYIYLTYLTAHSEFDSIIADICHSLWLCQFIYATSSIFHKFEASTSVILITIVIWQSWSSITFYCIYSLSLLELIFGLLRCVDQIRYFYHIVLHLSWYLQFLKMGLLLTTFSITCLCIVIDWFAHDWIQVWLYRHHV